MDKVVQNNAASAEESASAAEEMNAQAEEMKQMISGLMALIMGNKTAGTYKKSVGDKKYQRLATSKISHKTASERKIQLNAKRALPTRVSPEQVIPMDESDLLSF